MSGRHGRAVMPFGKHKGVRLRLLPDEYLSWLSGLFDATPTDDPHIGNIPQNPVELAVKRTYCSCNDCRRQFAERFDWLKESLRAELSHRGLRADLGEAISAAEQIEDAVYWSSEVGVGEVVPRETMGGESYGEDHPTADNRPLPPFTLELTAGPFKGPKRNLPIARRALCKFCGQNPMLAANGRFVRHSMPTPTAMLGRPATAKPEVCAGWGRSPSAKPTDGPDAGDLKQTEQTELPKHKRAYKL